MTPAPKPAFEVVSVEAIESEQRFNGTSKARPRPSPPYEARGDTARSTGHPMPPAALTPRSTDPTQRTSDPRQDDGSAYEYHEWARYVRVHGEYAVRTLVSTLVNRSGTRW